MDFVDTLGVEWSAPADLIAAAATAIKGCNGWQLYAPGERQQRLFGLVNSKLRLNKDRFQHFLDVAAETKLYLNYHDKAEVMECLDSGNVDRFARWISKRANGHRLSDLFQPISREETLKALHQQLLTGNVSRKDARNCGAAERREEVLRALFGSYVFSSFPVEAMHAHFNADCKKKYLPDFYQHLLMFHPGVLRRDCALIFLSVDQTLRKTLSAEQLRDNLYAFVRDAYDQVANHCFFAILIKAFRDGNEDGQWRLFSDLILYAEKHREVSIRAGYFCPEEIEQQTCSHIPHIDREAARFATAHEGFFFRDCLVLMPSDVGQVKTTSEAVDLLLLFDKNERDETVIPCPACRSRNVAGNSYPALGVRSWECQNQICPDRSAFDRGNRYSLSSLIKQEAIKSEEDQIPEWSLKKWKLDVVPGADQDAVTDLLLRHFSLHGDKVLFVNCPAMDNTRHGREIVYQSLTASPNNSGLYQRFQGSPYFKRFVVEREQSHNLALRRFPTGIPEAELYQGDCFEVLSSMATSSIDGAVTSPPYYNARRYAVWPNIYCYLYDMYNSTRQVFRVLKPGALYLFNIFDYFDNENNLVFSSMGKKRMILGAYIVNLFRRVGFELDGNVVWYKGEIEGKRNFNQGNRSPYYQLPFNCWEHVLVFRKPGDNSRKYNLPRILEAKPVIKMIRGKNVLGHSAPFPSAIPGLLLDEMEEGECVLDPFSGSMTTGRSAYLHGLRSISIELHREYCDLGLQLLKADVQNSRSLFGERDFGRTVVKRA